MNRASIDSPHPPHTAQTWGFRYHRWDLWMLIPKQKRLRLHLWQPYIHTWVPSYCQDHLGYTLSSNWSLLFDMYVYIYTVTTFKYTGLNIRTGISDYLQEGFPWPARPFKHTESNSFTHTIATFKYTNWYFILPPGPRGLARPPHI